VSVFLCRRCFCARNAGDRAHVTKVSLRFEIAASFFLHDARSHLALISFVQCRVDIAVLYACISDLCMFEGTAILLSRAFAGSREFGCLSMSFAGDVSALTVQQREHS